MANITTPLFGVIACDVLEDEVNVRIRRLGLQPAKVRFLEMGKHDYPDRLRQELQSVIRDFEDAGCRRILFVYGLCSNSIIGLRSGQAEMIFPRAHDCITLFLGSKERYAVIQKACPGTYWFSPGWCRGKRVPDPDQFDRLEAEFREKFEDEEDVAYLMEMERTKYKHYTDAGYTDLGDGDIQQSRDDTQIAARFLGMEFRHYPGDDGLLNRLLTGPWDDPAFVRVPPGETLRFTADESIIQCTQCRSAQPGPGA